VCAGGNGSIKINGEQRMAGKESLKQTWIEQVRETNPGQPYITPKQLAGILDTSYSKINYAISYGLIEGVLRMGPPGRKFELRIPKWAAVEYIKTFN
jgi:Fic family protein